MTPAPFRAWIQKAGLSGLLVMGAVHAACAQPLAVEIVDAKAAFDRRTSQAVISFKMSPASAKAFGEFTSRNVGRKMGLLVDGKLLSAPVIREPILGGTGQISGSLTTETARDLAARIAAGKAKVTFDIVD